MPTIFQHKVHIRKGEAVAKFWVEPEVYLAESYAMNARELKEIEVMVVAQQDIIKEKWHEFFSH